MEVLFYLYANRKAESAVTNVIVPLQPLFTARSGDVGSNSTAKPSVRDQTSNSSPAAIPNGSYSVALHEPETVGTPPQQPVMGPAANEALTAAQRLIQPNRDADALTSMTPPARFTVCTI